MILFIKNIEYKIYLYTQIYKYIQMNHTKCDYFCCNYKNVSYYTQKIKNEIIKLECNHIIHKSCLRRMLSYRYYQKKSIIINKSKLFSNLYKDDVFNSMSLGDMNDDDGIIKCPNIDCNKKYSLLSQYYITSKKPQLIKKIIVFENLQKTYLYHICHDIDIIHLLNKSDQYQLLSDFSYSKKFYITDKTITNNFQINKLFDYNYFIYHAVMYDKTIDYYPEKLCPVCLNSDDVHFKHASIYDFINIVIINKKYMEKSLSVIEI